MIGIDPSLARTGVSVVDLSARSSVVAWTVIKSAKEDDKATEDFLRRLSEIGSEFRAFVAPHLPAPICIEAQVGASFGKASMSNTFKLGAAYGAVVASCPTRPIAIQPSQVRRRLLGTKASSKGALRAYGKAEVGDRHPPEPRSKEDKEAVWDATGVVLALEPELERLASFSGSRNSESV